MAIVVFLGVLLGLMALGMPIAFALILTGVALMIQLDFFDAQNVALNVIEGANSCVSFDPGLDCLLCE